MAPFHNERHPHGAKKLYDDYKPYQNMNRNLPHQRLAYQLFTAREKYQSLFILGKFVAGGAISL